MCFVFMSLACILYFKTPLVYQFLIKEKAKEKGENESYRMSRSLNGTNKGRYGS